MATIAPITAPAYSTTSRAANLRRFQMQRKTRPTLAGIPGMIREVWLFAHALRLARISCRVDREPLPRIVARLSKIRGLPRLNDTEAAKQAARRACARMTPWFGALDSCLVRSLVTGALLASEAEVELNIGFRPDASAPSRVAGHAWITRDGRVVDDGEGGSMPGHETTYQSTLRLPMARCFERLR